jgi:hypothetical protein
MPHTLDGIPCRVVLFSWRVTWCLAPKPLNYQRIEVDHSQMITEHINDTLTSDARRQRGKGCEYRCLRHIE